MLLYRLATYRRLNYLAPRFGGFFIFKNFLTLLFISGMLLIEASQDGRKNIASSTEI